ncbi:salicylate synthase [Streptomyces marincola]|uniref:salicylate synthase n=1 Tax=Streptomyces marincola TaxID=2878388 RepID=UPI001CF141F2|nr:salicylate synthase [Streptomyces marincola]UCM87046.1 salicylate synthase [Streptomyces marincola]
MSSTVRLDERLTAYRGDAVAVAAALCAGSGEAHLLYENRGAVCWAEGEAAVVEVGSGGCSLVVAGERRRLDAAGAPLAAVGRALAEAGGEGWRAYGWASFGLSSLLLGGPAGEEPVLRMVLPKREIRFGDGSALLRARDPRELDALAGRLAAAAAGVPVPERRVAADVDGHGADAYRGAVAAAVRDIRAGALDKVILSREVPVPEEIDLPATYLAGRAGNNPARSFLLRMGGWEVAGFSPEIVTRVTAAREVSTQPLAGTRALTGDAEADLARHRELYRDAKEVHEHAMSVRLAATELGGICREGTVRVDDFMSVRERGSVQHLASRLSGRLREQATCWDALAAQFPAITASGIPKAAACERIVRSEANGRGLYSGAVLTADADGSLDAALVLRSVFRRGGRTWLRAGAGIVAQSDPERELEETREKLRSVCGFLVPAAPPAARPVSPRGA